MKKAFMLIGVPGAGKSTWCKNNPVENSVKISTDDFIEHIARMTDSTYDAVFESAINDATKNMNTALQFAIANNKHIIWDQTNISANSRKKKLKKIPNDYVKIAVVFETPEEDTLNFRLNNRVGKTIPNHIMKSMINGFEPPTLTEGFNEIIYVSNKSVGTN